MDASIRNSLISDNAFREIFQSMSEGIVMVDENGTIVTANAVAEELFEYPKNHMKGLPLEDLLPERYRTRHVGFRKSFVTHPEPRRMGVGRDLTALRKTGTEFPVEISLSFTEMQGKLLIMAFITDITLRKKSEEAIRRSEEQLIIYAAELEKKVEVRTEALNKTIEKLKNEVIERKKAEEESHKALEKERELNDLKSKFVSIASHEFRTPLSTILSSIALVDQYNVRGEPEKITHHSQRVRSTVNHLTGILNDFLSLGKLEEGKVDVNLEQINLAQLFTDISEVMRPTLKEGQKIITHLEGDAFAVSDPRILRNILFNLISNASKYSEANKNIYLSGAADARRFVVQIRDEGIGIPEADHRHLFERFFRAGNAAHIQGTGLGLHIVRRYAELLNGTVEFVSDDKKGTVFTVTISA